MEHKPFVERVVGAVLTATLIILDLLGVLLLPSDSEFLGIGVWKILVALTAIAALILVHGYHRENKSILVRLKDALQDRRRNPAQLRSIKDTVTTFFEDRDQSISWQDHAVGLTRHMLDARRYGLFESPEFADERAALIRSENESLATIFLRVRSMMGKKRSTGKSGSWEESVTEFRNWFIAALDREIELAEAELRD